MSEPVLEMAGVERGFRSGDSRVRVLAGADLVVAPGERVAVMGASGSGKSTLLHLAAGMDRPDAGHVRVLGTDLGALKEPQRTRFRARHVGLVFQDFNLLDSLTAAENIELVLWLNGERRRAERVRELAAALGIQGLLARHPAGLSGGEQQRVAIARALVHRPALILADEPTGSLDEDSAGDVLALLARAVEERQCALVLATHSRAAAAMCQRRLALRGGRLQSAED